MLCVLLFTQTDSNKFFSVSRSSRDFLSGLAAIFFAAYSRRWWLSKIFAAGGRLSRQLRGLVGHFSGLWQASTAANLFRWMLAQFIKLCDNRRVPRQIWLHNVFSLQFVVQNFSQRNETCGNTGYSPRLPVSNRSDIWRKLSWFPDSTKTTYDWRSLNKCKKTYQFKTHCKDDVLISLH